MSRTRISRTLIALMVVTILLGAIAYFHNPNRTKANQANNNQQPAASPATAPTPATRPTDPAPAPRVNQIALGGAAGRAIISQTPDATRSNPDAARAQPVISNAGSQTPTAPKPIDPKPAHPRPDAKPVVMASGASVLAQGKALIESNDLLTGRTLLNDALVSGSLSAADAVAARELICQANQTLIFSPRRVTDDPFVTSHTVKQGEKPMKIAAAYDLTWDFVARLNNIPDARKLRVGTTLKIIRGPFHAVVSKSRFAIDLYLGSPGEKGSVYVCTWKVGTGKNGSTPSGTWMVTPQNKLKNPKWWGTADEPAREADDPQNPLGEFWIGLQGTDGDAVGKVGFGIHGTIEPGSIGKEMSHGCIRLLNQDVERVYEMLIEGKSTVIVKE